MVVQPVAKLAVYYAITPRIAQHNISQTCPQVHHLIHKLSCTITHILNGIIPKVREYAPLYEGGLFNVFTVALYD